MMVRPPLGGLEWKSPCPRLKPRPPQHRAAHPRPKALELSSGMPCSSELAAAITQPSPPCTTTSRQPPSASRRVVRNEALAEEITQEAFLQVWSTGSTFDQTRGSAKSWVLTIVHRRSVDVVRHEQSARERSLRVGVRSIDQPFDSVWATTPLHAERTQVCEALKTLTQPQQQAIELAYYYGMTCSEVADRLPIPVGTAKSRILEGIRRLRRALPASDR